MWGEGGSVFHQDCAGICTLFVAYSHVSLNAGDSLEGECKLLFGKGRKQCDPLEKVTDASCRAAIVGDLPTDDCTGQKLHRCTSVADLDLSSVGDLLDDSQKGSLKVAQTRGEEV